MHDEHAAAATRIPMEKSYSPQQLHAWGVLGTLSVRTIIREFQDLPGIIKIGKPIPSVMNRWSKRVHRKILIPESVLQRYIEDRTNSQVRRERGGLPRQQQRQGVAL
jgi:hypothetical protein